MNLLERACDMAFRSCDKNTATISEFSNLKEGKTQVRLTTGWLLSIQLMQPQNKVGLMLPRIKFLLSQLK